jgi:quercetin dioxygenase-like cupin family protein
MKPIRLEEHRQFRPGKFRPKLVHGSPRVRAFLLCLEPGQGLPPRHDSEEVLCYVIRGSARLSIGEESYTTSAGEFAAAEPGQTRGIEAEEQCVVLWVHISSGEKDNE